jgi:Uma2 family endonuclease
MGPPGNVFSERRRAVSPKPVAAWTVADYERAAQEYLEALPPEHFMEATPHAAQREITVESFAVLKVRRPDVQMCNELLVQCPINAHVVQVCPDNMVLLREEPLEAMGSFNTPFEPGQIFWVLEYVSPSNKRKDYEDNFRKYQDDLKVPYYLIFDPEVRDLRLYHHNGVAYEAVAPNAAGRLPVPKLEVEVGLRDGWARFWYRGKLLPLPADLQHQLDDLKARLKRSAREAGQARRLAQREKERADEQKRRADEQEKRAKAEAKRVREERRLRKESQQRQAEAEEEIKRLRALLEQARGGQG